MRTGIFTAVFWMLISLQQNTVLNAKEIRDWFVWCESDLECTMQTSNSEQQIFGFGFKRGPKANSPVIPFLASGHKILPGSAIQLIVDDNTQAPITLESTTVKDGDPTLYFAPQSSNHSVIKTVMSARKMVLVISTENGTKRVPLSVSGATGSALYVDEAQLRVDNQDALKAIGSGIPQDAKSQVTRLRSKNDLPAPIKTAWSSNNGECSDDYDGGDLIERFGGERINGEAGIFLYILPCGGPGAYNLPSSAYVFDTQENRATRIYFPTMSEEGPSVNETAINTSWDHVDKTLGAYYKGRGIGDCGVASHWKWEGHAYAQLILVREYAKHECDGKHTDWPQVWPLQNQ